MVCLARVWGSPARQNSLSSNQDGATAAAVATASNSEGPRHEQYVHVSSMQSYQSAVEQEDCKGNDYGVTITTTAAAAQDDRMAAHGQPSRG